MSETETKPKAILAWSSGKDSAYALHVAQVISDRRRRLEYQAQQTLGGVAQVGSGQRITNAKFFAL